MKDNHDDRQVWLVILALVGLVAVIALGVLIGYKLHSGAHWHWGPLLPLGVLAAYLLAARFVRRRRR